MCHKCGYFDNYYLLEITAAISSNNFIILIEAPNNTLFFFFLHQRTRLVEINKTKRYGWSFIA